MRVTAPAKINLHLRVGRPTADGFHPLVSWMVTVGLFDNLEFMPAGRGGVELSCDDPTIPVDGSNLIVKVALRLLEESAGQGRKDAVASGITGIRAVLEKRIPVGAGLGGGSSDGAYTMLALNEMLGLHWSAQRMSDFVAQFGSDLSFFCHGESAVCTGRGQFVERIAPPAPRWAVLILPGIHMPTPAVYRRFDELGLGEPGVLEQAIDWRKWTTMPAEDLLSVLVNDLETPAFQLCRPLELLHKDACMALRRTVRMSGSGSSLFTIYDSQAEAADAARLITEKLSTRAIACEICPKLSGSENG